MHTLGHGSSIWVKIAFYALVTPSAALQVSYDI